MVTPAQSAPNILDELNQPYRNPRYDREYDNAFPAVSNTDGSIVQADTVNSDFSGNIVQVKKGGNKDKGNDDSNGNNDDRRNNGNTYRFDNDLEYQDGRGQGQGQGAAGGGLELTWGNPLGLVGQLMEMSSGPGGGPETPTDSPSGHRTVRVGRRR
ncbi:hypothetical protein FZ103_17435 [Streptomonospora sp. PA3]|uniref:hypothetical protein n=1 Tax=Streptomonospora sp. PA3 TaxID=2607326 RepID=UPI0012DE77BE|nr:hypothetical protein [Streptomonospora sp. PA3]MUL42928.1 hypothetical protein [Streptomonospora sp. PA3]